VTATPGQPDEVTLAVIGARLEDMREDIRSLRADLASHRADLVPRGEWEQRNHHVDGRFQEHGREIANLRTEVRSSIATVKAEVDQRRAPWWTVGALVISGAALLLTLIPALTRTA